LNKKIKDIGDELDVNWKQINPKQFEMGMKVELEHGTKNPKTNITNDDPIKTAKIALSHLYEKNNYYSELKKVESK